MSDLISRCELFNRLAPVQTLGEAYGIIQEMPTVDAVPVVHGRWILKKADSGFHTDCVCSECKRRFAIGWNYCPNCGARMDGDDNG